MTADGAASDGQSDTLPLFDPPHWFGSWASKGRSVKAGELVEQGAALDDPGDIAEDVHELLWVDEGKVDVLKMDGVE